MFVCGDNEWGQTGYQWKRPGRNNSSPTFGMSEDDDETGAESAMEISLRVFQAPVLLEGAHVPASVAQVACGARHTAALAHSGRLYVYGGEVLRRCVAFVCGVEGRRRFTLVCIVCDCSRYCL